MKRARLSLGIDRRRAGGASMHTRIRHAAVFMALLLAAGAGLAEKVLAQAQPDGYPSRVVSLVIPYPPGGSADGMARPLAQQISAAWPNPVIILSKPGAGTTVGEAF